MRPPAEGTIQTGSGPGFFLSKRRSFFSEHGWDFMTCLPNSSHHMAVKVMHDREPSISSVGADA